MRVLGFHHVAVFANDVEKVAAFYREVLGLPELARYPLPGGGLRAIWLSASHDGAPMGGFLAIEAAAVQPTPGSAVIALRIEAPERERLKRELAVKGVAIEKETRWTTYVRDPEGNVVAFSHHPHDPLNV